MKLAICSLTVQGSCEVNPAASLLAVGRDVVAEPLTYFWATSAAVGMAGNFAGQLQAALPDLWPENTSGSDNRFCTLA